MQAIAAYVIFMLAFTALGLSMIVAGVLSIALYGGASWIWWRLSPPIVEARRPIERSCRSLDTNLDTARSIRIPICSAAKLGSLTR